MMPVSGGEVSLSGKKKKLRHGPCHGRQKERVGSKDRGGGVVGRCGVLKRLVFTVAAWQEPEGMFNN